MRHPPLRLSRLLSSTASQQVMETKAKLEMDLTRKSGVNSKTIAIMKKMIKNLMLVAVAAMGFTACNDSIEEATRPIEPAEVKMTITADVDETRTWIDEANSKVQWSEGDALKVIENGATYRTTKAATIDANGLAKFTVSFPANTDATEFTYNAIYPVSRVTEDNADKMDMTKIKVTLPDAQSPTATSFDPTADILVAKQIVTNTQPTELSMQFKRLVAMGKMTLTNLPESSTISKVIFTVEDTDAEEQPALAGRNYVDATTGTIVEYGYYGATNAITLNYNEPISTRDIYFTCNPFELVAGDKFTVKVVCSDATYTREVTLPEGRTLGFIEGDLSKFSVNMAGATKETNFVFPDGEYAAIAVVSNKYYALSSAANGKRLNAVEVTYTPGEGLTTTDATLKWTVAKTDSGYTFKGSNNQYIAWSSGTYANTQDDVYYLDITEDAENAGRYVVTSKADATRKLQKNSNYPYFAFYDSAQSGSLYLVPVTIDETTEPEPEPTPGDVMTIADVLAKGNGATIGGVIEGVVISNMDLNNLTSKKGMYVQDETGALQFYLAANHEFAFGTKVKIDLTTATLGSYNGAVQVSGVALDKITVVSTDNTVEAKTVSMADFLANKYEGQYIALEGVQVAASDLSNTWVMGSAHTSITMEDANGNSFVVFSSKYASYGAETVAQGAGTIKGISSISKGAIQIIFAQSSDYAGLNGERFGDAGNETPDPEPTDGIKYTKITSDAELTDGKYIIVYENGANASVFNGKDAVNGYTEATISNGSITVEEAFESEVTIEAMNDGYSLKVTAGYMYGTSGSNKLNFNSTTAQLNTIKFENDGSATITSNTSVLRFNNASNQLRFRYFKSSTYSSQKAVALYKRN